jgi:hypothetical protein
MQSSKVVVNEKAFPTSRVSRQKIELFTNHRCTRGGGEGDGHEGTLEPPIKDSKKCATTMQQYTKIQISP